MAETGVSWLLTWTTYGTWLPGDRRGSVSPVRNSEGEKIIVNTIGAPYLPELRNLSTWSRNRLVHPPVRLDSLQARNLLSQFQETAKCRGWRLPGVAILPNHVHLVAAGPENPSPSRLLGSFKSYASRVLNQGRGPYDSRKWWTDSGSKRKIRNPEELSAVLGYLCEQRRPLLIWIDEEFRYLLN